MGDERIHFACDVANLWTSCRRRYGKFARIDFQILRELMPARSHPKPVKQKLTAYIVTNPTQRHHAFYSMLRGHGYQVRERAAKSEKLDWDVGITVDSLRYIDDYDTFVLAGGDGDFIHLIHYLSFCNKRTVYLTFDDGESSLKNAVTEVVVLGETSIYEVGTSG